MEKRRNKNMIITYLFRLKGLIKSQLFLLTF